MKMERTVVVCPINCKLYTSCMFRADRGGNRAFAYTSKDFEALQQNKNVEYSAGILVVDKNRKLPMQMLVGIDTRLPAFTCFFYQDPKIIKVEMSALSVPEEVQEGKRVKKDKDVKEINS